MGGGGSSCGASGGQQPAERSWARRGLARSRCSWLCALGRLCRAPARIRVPKVDS